MKLWLVILLSLLLSNCKSTSDEEVSKFSQTTPPAAGNTFSGSSGQYVFAPGDVVVVHVDNSRKFSGSYVVDKNGYIRMPVIGAIYANKRSASLLKNAIEAKLRPHVKYPRVKVSTGRLASYKVIISGKVRKPGTYSFNRKTTLLEGIALAGGIYGSNAGSILVRTGSD